jgi:hypothetical protein
MSDQTRQQLQQANTYIQNGQRDQARALLESLVKTDPTSAEAWWLLSMVASTPAQMREALQNVLRIQPDNKNAREQLDKLDAQASAAATPPVEDPFAPPTRTLPSGSQMGESLDELFGPTPSSAAKTPTPGPTAGPGYTPPPYTPPSPGAKSQRNPLLYVLLGLVIAAVCICGACLLLFGGSIAAVLSNPTVQAAVSTGITLIQAPDSLPAGVATAGTLSANQQRTGSLEPLSQQVWKYDGKQGEQITISASGSNLELYLGLYDSGGKLISRTNIGNTGRSQTLTATLPSDATYSILVGALGGNFGSYTIEVRSGSSQ